MTSVLFPGARDVDVLDLSVGGDQLRSSRQLGSGSFRERVQTLVNKRGRKFEVIELQGVACWLVRVNFQDSELVLHVYEHTANDQEAEECEQCRCMGWSHIPIPEAQYHFIVPPDSLPSNLRQTLPNLVENRRQGVPDSETCNPQITGAVYESKFHLLHGMVHCNGFGHMMRLNGKEGGSKIYSGHQLMELWDRICTVLNCRYISTEDVSNKRGMELRVLHPVAYEGLTFYGEWGYTYGRGAFNIQKDQWENSIQYLANASIEDIIHDFQQTQDSLQFIGIVSHYAGQKPRKILTLGAWIKQMLEFLKVPQNALDFVNVEQLRYQQLQFQLSQQNLKNNILQQSNGVIGKQQQQQGKQIGNLSRRKRSVSGGRSRHAGQGMADKQGPELILEQFILELERGPHQYDVNSTGVHQKLLPLKDYKLPEWASKYTLDAYEKVFKQIFPVFKAITGLGWVSRQVIFNWATEHYGLTQQDKMLASKIIVALSDSRIKSIVIFRSQARSNRGNVFCVQQDVGQSHPSEYDTIVQQNIQEESKNKQSKNASLQNTNKTPTNNTRQHPSGSPFSIYPLQMGQYFDGAIKSVPAMQPQQDKHPQAYVPASLTGQIRTPYLMNMHGKNNNTYNGRVQQYGPLVSPHGTNMEGGGYSNYSHPPWMAHRLTSPPWRSRNFGRPFSPPQYNPNFISQMAKSYMQNGEGRSSYNDQYPQPPNPNPNPYFAHYQQYYSSFWNIQQHQYMLQSQQQFQMQQPPVQNLNSVPPSSQKRSHDDYQDVSLQSKQDLQQIENGGIQNKRMRLTDEPSPPEPPSPKPPPLPSATPSSPESHDQSEEGVQIISPPKKTVPLFVTSQEVQENLSEGGTTITTINNRSDILNDQNFGQNGINSCPRTGQFKIKLKFQQNAKRKREEYEKKVMEYDPEDFLDLVNDENVQEVSIEDLDVSKVKFFNYGKYCSRKKVKVNVDDVGNDTKSLPRSIRKLLRIENSIRMQLAVEQKKQFPQNLKITKKKNQLKKINVVENQNLEKELKALSKIYKKSTLQKQYVVQVLESCSEFSGLHSLPVKWITIKQLIKNTKRPAVIDPIRVGSELGLANCLAGKWLLNGYLIPKNWPKNNKFSNPESLTTSEASENSSNYSNFENEQLNNLLNLTLILDEEEECVQVELHYDNETATQQLPDYVQQVVQRVINDIIDDVVQQTKKKNLIIEQNNFLPGENLYRRPIVKKSVPYNACFDCQDTDNEINEDDFSDSEEEFRFVQKKSNLQQCINKGRFSSQDDLRKPTDLFKQRGAVKQTNKQILNERFSNWENHDNLEDQQTYVRVYFFVDNSHIDAKLVQILFRFENQTQSRNQSGHSEHRRPRTPRSCFRGPEAWLKQVSQLLPLDSTKSVPKSRGKQKQQLQQMSIKKIISADDKKLKELETRILIREKIISDLLIVYQSIFQVYGPLHGFNNGYNYMTPGFFPFAPNLHTLKLPNFETHVGILKDTKLFQKNYFTLDKSISEQKQIHIICYLLLPHSEFQLRSPRPLTQKEKRDPPWEAVRVSPRSSWGEAMRKIEGVFRGMYVMLKGAVVKEVRMKGQEAAVVGEALVGENCRFGKVDVDVLMENIDYNLSLRFVGGWDVCNTKCSCGIVDDDGARMIQCDVCSTWMHTRCVGIGDAQEPPESFTCQSCSIQIQQQQTNKLDTCGTPIDQNEQQKTV